MKYTESQLQELHTVEKEILSEIIRICTENKLSFFLDWGSLLGVVRHGGFIPWDDDIDICMPRDDYEIFLEIAPSKLREGYILQHYLTEPLTPQYCAKIRKDNTLFVEEYAVNLPIHQGVYIDIYPIDKVPDNVAVSKRYQQKATFLKQLFISKIIHQPSYTKTKIKKILLSVIRTTLSVLLLPVSREYIYTKLNQHLMKYNGLDCEKVSCIGTKRGEHYVDDIFPLQDAFFEGIAVKVPNHPDRILTDEYGDYMQLPAEEKRIGHCPALFKI